VFTSFHFPRLDIDGAAVPVTPTAVYPFDCSVIELEIVNPTNGAIIVTVTNAAGVAWLSQSIAAAAGGVYSLMEFRSAVGKTLRGGMLWSANAPGLKGSVCLRTQ
jgi:hypothetical protein